MTKIQVWTLQPISVWERLQTDGVLYADLSLSPNPSLHDSFEWMRQQMLRRIPGCRGRFPWWGYHRPKPDLRKFRHVPQRVRKRSGETRQCVRLELSLDASAVLLHDADAWDMSLIPGTILFDAAQEAAYWNLLDAEQQRCIRETRERLFDIDALRRSLRYTEDHIEATFERLALVDVVGIRQFLEYL